MTEICEELSKEKNLVFYDKKEYYRDVLKKIVEIFTKLGVDKEMLKNEKGEYRICISQKEKLKDLINSYTSPAMKLVRKNKFEEMNLQELQHIIAQVESILKSSVDYEEYLKQQSMIYNTTSYPYLKTREEVRLEGIQQVVKDMEDIKPIFNDKSLNLMDKVHLLYYYKQLIQEVSMQWREIVDILSENRKEEIRKNSMQLAEEGLSDEEIEKVFSDIISDSPKALIEAVQIYQEEIYLKSIKKMELQAIKEKSLEMFFEEDNQ